jgi:hypothetical protein
VLINRIAIALKSQEWSTVFIEFVLVVVGVLVALEVDRYNERQKEREQELQFLHTLQRDLGRDIDDVKLMINGYQTIESFGFNAIETLNQQGCEQSTCWRKLVELFHAGQWLDVSRNDSTYEEMKRAGLPRNSALKTQLDQYYFLAAQQKVLTQELPAFREWVRSIIPPAMQRHIWANCFTVSGRFETYSTECSTPTTDEAARVVVQELQATPAVKRALTFWLSNVSLTTITLPQTAVDAEQAIAAVQAEIDR